LVNKFHWVAVQLVYFFLSFSDLTYLSWHSTSRKHEELLMSAGFHGNNGLDPGTYIHIMKTYVIPTLFIWPRSNNSR
jgi:hypothetical protein